MNTSSRPSLVTAYVMMHTAVILYGFTAILGKLISISGTTLVWYRLLIAMISFCFFPGILGQIRAIPVAVRWRLAGIGLLMALHWATFYEAIKYSNVSITLSCLASTSFFTSLIEPIFFGRRIQWYEVLLGLMVVLGFGFIFGFTGGKYSTGIIIAMISALTIAIAGVLNKVYVSEYPVGAISMIEFAGGWVLLSIIFPVYVWAFPDKGFVPTLSDTLYLLILALVCTTLAYTLTMTALKVVSAYTAALAINLEPVYGILMAYGIFHENEELNGGFYVGTGIILLSVVLHPILRHYAEKQNRQT
ncbi:MAG: EamA family transporter [Bacteroidia bacterium]|nr:EamA family transporter [Bacteroidia bacterium]